jgi:hypothetical protein
MIQVDQTSHKGNKVKLTNDSISKLDLLIQTSLTAGIKKLVIESGKIRGIDEKQSVCVITSDNVPDFDGKQVGINRLEQLAARLNLVKSQGGIEIEATEASNKTDISILDLSAGKTKAQFRCASVEAVKGVPKNIADTLVWEIKIDSKALPTISQGVTAMGAETVTLACKDGKTVSIELVDQNKDIFTTDLSEAPVWIGSGTAQTSFCQKYPAKNFVGLVKEALKTSDPLSMKLGEGGIFSFKVNGFDFFMLPAQ